MQHDLNGALNGLGVLLDSMGEIELLVKIALDCIDYESEGLTEKLELLLDCIGSKADFVTDELPYCKRVIEAAIAQASDRPEF